MRAEMTRAVVRDELANSLSHALGLAGAIAATPVLIVSAARRGGPADVVGASIFGATLILLYLASTAFHAVGPGPAKELLRKLDHSAIYVLIAGTYTPFTLGVLGGGWGWTLFGLVWAAATIGIVAKFAGRSERPWVSAATYLVMGWLVLIAIHPLVTRVPRLGVAWLVAGGLCYSGGVAFYLRRARFSHLIWHVFVLAGSACHFVAVLRYAG